MGRGLWYRQPANCWTEALPLGNGRLGAMVYGGVPVETIALNEDTLWSGVPDDRNESGRAPYFKQARALAQKGEYAQAQACIEANFPGEYNESYMPLGTLTLEFDHRDTYGYTRRLSLEQAVQTTEYFVGDTRFYRELFVSEPDQALLLRLSCEGTEKLSLKARLGSPLRHRVFTCDGRLELEGQCPSHVEPSYVESGEPVIYRDDVPGIRYRAVLAANTDGRQQTQADALMIEDATYVVFVLTARSNFRSYREMPETGDQSYAFRAQTEALTALSQSFETLRTRHTADFAAFYSRTALRLGSASPLPTDERLRAFQEDPSDLDLEALLFDYGRYLLISCSRPGTQAANLQGIWNDSIRPPWSSNYTTNINVQMNYWPALPCGMPELHEPLCRMVCELAQAGRETARAYYGAGGFAVHHNVDLWRHCNPVGRRRRGGSGHDFWPMAGGWLAQHLYAQYRFTGDRTFLREAAYPCLKAASRFFLDTLCDDGAGGLAFIPASSPENKFYYGGETLALAKTATMSTAIIRDTLQSTLACACELGQDAALRGEIERTLSKLPDYALTADGRLREWNEDFEEADPTHRHISQLYGLYPSHQLPAEFAEACRRTLERRTDEGTGWSLGWKLCLWARLGDGEHAHNMLRNQLRLCDTSDYSERLRGGGSYPNLMDAHPPFQIDGNFGATAGIAEMLLQSHGNHVQLLPALPASWREGSVDGLYTEGGIRVSMVWRVGRLQTAELLAPRDMSVRVTLNGNTRELLLKRGSALCLKGEATC